MTNRLKRPAGIYVRDGKRPVGAPAEDQAVAYGYPNWPDKGPISAGVRLTVMTRKKTYGVAEEVRVLHAFEAVESGTEAHVMGPKPVCGEHLDNVLVSPPPPARELPWVPDLYDGAVLPAPAVDLNFDITTYTFDEPGEHEFEWRLGKLRSNKLRIKIVHTPPDSDVEGR